jgi:hypothetical protein
VSLLWSCSTSCLEPIPRLFNLVLRRQRSSRLERFSKMKKLFLHFFIML